MLIYKKTTKINTPRAVGYPIANYLGITKAVTPKTHNSVILEYPGKVIINWGVSTLPDWFLYFNGAILNNPILVYNSVNKVRMLKLFKSYGISTLDFMTDEDKDKSKAEEFYHSGKRIIVRHKITSHSGNGIEIVEPKTVLPKAQLYTLQEDFIKEFRAFVVGSEVVDVVVKKKMGKAKLEKLGLTEPHPIIRSNKNGWVFARQDDSLSVLSSSFYSLCVQAVTCLGLDFGAVDVGMIQHFLGVEFKVIEVNSAPGLDNPTTIQKFGDALRKRVKKIENSFNVVEPEVPAPTIEMKPTTTFDIPVFKQ